MSATLHQWITVTAEKLQEKKHVEQVDQVAADCIATANIPRNLLLAAKIAAAGSRYSSSILVLQKSHNLLASDAVGSPEIAAERSGGHVWHRAVALNIRHE